MAIDLRWVRITLLLASGIASGAGAQATNETRTGMETIKNVEHLNDFQVIEFRRYQTTPGARENFATYFESFFPEAFEQLGAIVFGEFFERGRDGFTWLRGYHDIYARAPVNAAFYYGPLWREHRATMNALLVDSDNVLLLQPLSRSRGVPVLPAVDPVHETADAHGIVAVQIFALKADSVETFATQAETVFAKYREAGAREAGVLVTLAVANNFPQLPIRTDGPYLLWIGLLRDDAALKTRFMPATANAAPLLAASGLLRGEPELVILDPAKRSRLRWLP
jgi:hypothetical protein